MLYELGTLQKYAQINRWDTWTAPSKSPADSLREARLRK
jgi:hypothetical protein